MGFDGLALRFQERRQREPLTQGFNIFVYRKARPVGRNLEQYAARLAEVDRTEVEAVNHRRNRWVDQSDLIPPLAVFLLVWRTECHVMHPADANEAAQRPFRSN